MLKRVYYTSETYGETCIQFNKDLVLEGLRDCQAEMIADPDTDTEELADITNAINNIEKDLDVKETYFYCYSFWSAMIDIQTLDNAFGEFKAYLEEEGYMEEPEDYIYFKVGHSYQIFHKWDPNGDTYGAVDIYNESY